MVVMLVCFQLSAEEKEWMVVCSTANYLDMHRLLSRKPNLAKVKVSQKIRTWQALKTQSVFSLIIPHFALFYFVLFIFYVSYLCGSYVLDHLQVGCRHMMIGFDECIFCFSVAV